MSRIARAASCTWPSRTIASSCGRRVWSIITTVCPSAASQIVRIGRPATFIAASLLQNPSGDRIAPREEVGIAVLGRGDQCVLKRVVAALPARPGMARQQRHRGLDQGPRALGIGIKNREDHVDRHVVVARMPAIDRKSTRLNSSHRCISYAVFCLKKKKKENNKNTRVNEMYIRDS